MVSMAGRPLSSATAATLNLSSVGIQHALVYQFTTSSLKGGGDALAVCAFAGIDDGYIIRCSVRYTGHKFAAKVLVHS